MSKLEQFKEELNLLPALGKLVNLGCAFSVASYKGKQLLQFTSPKGYVLDITLDSLIFDNFTLNVCTKGIFGFERKNISLCGLGDISRIWINDRKEVHFMFEQNKFSRFLCFVVTNETASFGNQTWIKNDKQGEKETEIMQTYKFHMYIYNFIIGAHKLSVDLGVTND
ncbi:hypothetical protein phiOC_p221 [Ochrobactrum phage vB_OspM_OC]|nr:hypothetical protein phiOC_p221 [Ochrobactrum phage vB_OspM_OC]